MNIDRTKFKIDDFIKKANEKHNNKFDYSEMIYTNYYEEIIIKCPIHGKFSQRPDVHLKSKHACKTCFKETRTGTTLDEFISRAIDVHGNKYDYSLVSLDNLQSKVCIICPVHGKFTQFAFSHINKNRGCRKCFSETKVINIDEFITRASKMHNNKYDYSLVKYKTLNDKINITCPIHGVFIQSATKHIGGNGCTKCNSRPPVTTEIFINKAKEIHGDLYSYDKTVYMPGKQPSVIITCKVHGDFKQNVNKHIGDKNGCPKCRSSHGEILISKILDSLNIKYESQKRFSDCRHKKPLPFDFYLPDYNTCIEYQGEQHYRTSAIWGFTQERLEMQQYRDSIKREYCIKNSITLIEIKYTRNYDYIYGVLSKLNNTIDIM